MPLYDFWCETCQTSFEALLSRGDLSSVRCPSCRSSEVERLISNFAAPSGKAEAGSGHVHSSGCGCGAPKQVASHCGVDWRSS